MKTLLFTNLFPSSLDRVRGVFTRQLARDMGRLCELNVMVPLPWFPRGPLARWLPHYGRQFAGLAAHMEWDGNPVSYPRYPLLPKLSDRYHAHLMRLGVGARIAQLHAAIGLDVINAHWLYPDGVVAASVGRRLGIPVVLTALGCDANEFLLHENKRRQILWALAAADAITTVSTPLRAALVEAGVAAERITVIPNGVDVERFQPRDRRDARNALGVADDAPLVVCVARLSEEKGVRYLVGASLSLRESIPRVRIVIVGDGPEQRALDDQIRASGVNEVVALTGGVSHERVALWLSAADVVCLPSLREGHPNAAMEALASGRPLVASRVGPLSDLIDETCGELVPPADSDALAAALARALMRRWSADAIAARVGKATWSSAAARYVDVLHSVALDARTTNRAAVRGNM